MKLFFTLAYSMFIAIGSIAQSFPVGHRSVTFNDPSRSNRAVPTELYYPASVAGTNAPVAAGTMLFPVVVFGHGFVIGTGSYEWLADSLVKNGYIVALPSTEGGLSPSHGQFGDDLSFLCSRITSLNDSVSSFLYQRVIKKAAVGGHSMGGGASFLAAAKTNASIITMFNFSAAETSPSAASAALNITKPSLVFSGSNDCVAGPAVQQAMYNNLSSCKFLINITNALHCQFANNNGTCALGQALSGCNSSSISTADVFNKVTSLLLPFLDNYLKGNCIRGNDFDFTYASISGVTKQRSCLPFPTCGVLPVNLLDFSGVMTSGSAHLKFTTQNELNIQQYIVERSADGINFSRLTTMQAKSSNGGAQLYTCVDPYPFSGTSFYRIRIGENNGNYSFSPVVRLLTIKKTVGITGLFPNPVKTTLTVQLQSDRGQEIVFSIRDITGRQLLFKTAAVLKGTSLQYFDCSKLSAGTYLLECFQSETMNSVDKVKFVK